MEEKNILLLANNVTLVVKSYAITFVDVCSSLNYQEAQKILLVQICATATTLWVGHDCGDEFQNSVSRRSYDASCVACASY